MFKGHSGERGNNGEDREIVLIQAGIPSFIHDLDHANGRAIPAFERDRNHIARDGARHLVDFLKWRPSACASDTMSGVPVV